MDQSRALGTMTGNVVTTGLLVLFLSFRSEPWLWLFPLGALVMGRWQGKHFWSDFFADRLSSLGLGGLSLGLLWGICYVDPLWLSTFWLTIGGGLLGLGGALAGTRLQYDGDLITPDPAIYFPVRVNRLLSIVWGSLIWSLPEIALPWRAPLAVLFITLGLMSVGTWQLGIVERKLTIGFRGIISSSYQFSLDRYQRLLLVKLQEGGITWLQLTNPKEEVTLPIILLENTIGKGEITDKLSQVYPFVRQVATRDSLQMMGILLPQSMGIFAGISSLVVGTILWMVVQIPESQSYTLTWLLGSSFLVSPVLAWGLFLLVVPGSIAPQTIISLPAWELGILLLVVNLVSQSEVMPLLLATIGFLCWGIGIYIFQLVRVIPITSKT